MLQQIALGGTMIALPIYLQMVLEYNAMQAGLSLVPLSLSMFAVALLAGRKAGERRPSRAIMLATLSFTFTNLAESSAVLPAADQQRVANALEHDAEVMSNTRLDALLADEPKEIRDEIIRINTDARPRALQVALLIPVLAGLVGLFNAFRMMRLPDPAPSRAVEGVALG